jgi:hypothetical protein
MGSLTPVYLIIVAAFVTGVIARGLIFGFFREISPFRTIISTGVAGIAGAILAFFAVYWVAPTIGDYVLVTLMIVGSVLGLWAGLGFSGFGRLISIRPSGLSLR